MKKIFTLLIGTVFSLTILNAQDAPPQAFSFKAVVKAPGGQALASRTVGLRLSILQGEANGLAVYSESFTTTTNIYSQVDVEIGRGTVLSGDFTTINWATGIYFLKVELDIKGGTNYSLLSVAQLLSVPYAMYAGNLSGGQDNDDDPLNELISNAYLSGTSLVIVEGNETTIVELSGLLNGVDVSSANELQNLSINGHELTIQNGNTIILPDETGDADADPSNEIQVLSLEGNILTLTTTGTPIQIDLAPYLDNTDSQTLTVDGHKLTIANGNTVDLPDNIDDADSDPTNEIQQLSLEGDIISLSKEGGSVVLPVANTFNGLFYYGDKDNDGYGDLFKAIWIPVNVSPPARYVLSSTDCNDSDPLLNPGVKDNCDGVDNDCDGETDEDCLSPVSYQMVLQFLNCAEESGCEANPECIFNSCMPQYEEIMNSEQGPCLFENLINIYGLPSDETWTLEAKANYIIEQCISPDNDHDGYTVDGGDCNDADPSINPGVIEIPGDGIDQNCNGRDGIAGDTDDDGYTEATGDCDNNDASVYPGAPDICDNKDNDCDGSIDEDADWVTYYMDVDHDGYGGQEISESYCSEENIPEGFVPNNADCNDHDSEINPDATENDLSVCGDGIDQDCNGSDLPCTAVTDDDGDGYSEVNGDCNDSDNTIYPGAPEICGDNIDQDCNGRDKICGDNDDDGYTPDTGDCDDNDPSVYPGAEEICGDGIDQNCDGIADEGCCLAALVQLLNCAEGSGCGLTDMSCLLQCTEGEFFFQECISLECIGNLVSEGLPFDETWTVNAKAEYFLSHCGTSDNDGDGWPGMEGDCDDTNPAINPGAAEVCGDGIDQNCDGIDPPAESCVDNDGDGFTELRGDCNDADPTIYPGATDICGDGIDQNCSGEDASCNDKDEDGVSEGDCDDNDPTVYPGAEEICDGKDNDCNGQIDELYNTTWYPDADSDGWGNSAAPVVSCDDLNGYSREGGDCDDTNPAINPGAAEVCGDGIDQNCDGIDPPTDSCVDNDGDGYTELQGDCDDTDPSIHPNTEEICDDGKDNDCSGGDLLCSDLVDNDGDHFSEVDGDCNDNDPIVYPGAEEICDGKDNNCDGNIDEGVDTWYRDNDGDGYGNYEDWIKSCDQQAGYVFVGGDCNDGDPEIHPNATDICGDGIDQNCTGSDASCTDMDEDGFTVPEDCDDNNPNINPEAEEVCDGIDNNCDGNIDETAPMWFRDLDGDGFGGMEEQIQSCEPVEGYVENGDDCNDFDDTVNPGALEICGDDIDQNCDGIDEPCPPEETDDDYDGFTENQGDCNDFDPSVYPGADEICGDGIDQDCSGSDLICPEDTDDDGDGITERMGDCDDTNPEIYPGADEICSDGIDQDCNSYDLSCLDVDNDGDGYTENQGDCDDTNPAIYPGASETADGLDNDCDGTIDEGTEYFDDDGDGYAENNGDCNDADASIHPYATEVCDDGIDQDCNDSDLSCLDFDNDGDGYTENQGDCDDTNPAVHPGAIELCGNGLDDDCFGGDMVCETSISSVSPASLTLSAGTSGIVYVILAAPAGPDGVVVSVSTTNSCFYTPSTLTIPAGLTNAGAIVNALCASSGTVVFTLGSQQIIVPVTVNP